MYSYIIVLGDYILRNATKSIFHCLGITGLMYGTGLSIRRENLLYPTLSLTFPRGRLVLKRQLYVPIKFLLFQVLALGILQRAPLFG